jgi:hypothetical protein
MKTELHTFHKARDAKNEFHKFLRISMPEKVILHNMEFILEDTRHLFRVITDMESAYRLAGYQFSEIHFNGMIDSEARQFLLTRKIQMEKLA